MYVNPRTRVPTTSQLTCMTQVHLHTSWEVFPPVKWLVRRLLGFDSKVSPTGLCLEDLDCFLFWRSWWLAGRSRSLEEGCQCVLTCFWFKPEISASWLAKMWEASISSSWQHRLFPVAASYQGWLKSLWNVGVKVHSSPVKLLSSGYCHSEEKSK